METFSQASSRPFPATSQRIGGFDLGPGGILISPLLRRGGGGGFTFIAVIAMITTLTLYCHYYHYDSYDYYDYGDLNVYDYYCSLY